MDIKRLALRNRSGERIGLPSFCSANENVLSAALGFAACYRLPILVEATCNQVNQDGGYTGLRPAEFVALVAKKAQDYGLDSAQLVLGGDHLGPHPWRHLPAEQAMQRAERLVHDYVAAGFQKIHLDASMACRGEPTPTFELVASRAARLCAVAEQTAADPTSLHYVIGTEVPVPGGETDDMNSLRITSPEMLDATIGTHIDAFAKAGVMQAWDRVVSVVAQPGVDFSHSAVHVFDRTAALPLIAAIEQHGHLTFEGHSTDYQPAEALAGLVASHVLFLKVGPELTFAFREAVFALARIEHEMGVEAESGIVACLDAAMNDRPGDWKGYYTGQPSTVRRLRYYSLSDRIRYYWQATEVQEALARLRDNLQGLEVPSGLADQYLGDLERIAEPWNVDAALASRVVHSVRRYYEACGWQLERT